MVTGLHCHTLFRRREECPLKLVTFETFSQPWDLFELHRKAGIDALWFQFAVTQLHILVADGHANHMRGYG